MTEGTAHDFPTSAPALRDYPSRLFVETTTRCNLGCFMCVKQSRGGGIGEGDLSPAIFEALAPAFPRLEALVLNGIGEPLLHPGLESFIRRAKGLMPKEGWVGFQSNSLLLTPTRALSLVEAGLDRICLSVDASSPETFRKVREGGELRDMEQALTALAVAKKSCGRPEVKVGIEFVVMQSNLRELPAALRWAASQGASFAITTHLLPYDELHGKEAAYETCTGEAVALFELWREMADENGVDLYRYFEARWKYARSREEQRIVDLVEAMKAEANRQGIFLDMKKLLRIDQRRHKETMAVFAEARFVAQEIGIELRLPEAAMNSERRCRFVEEGGAFVAWNGNVSPCYFLWHSYRCFAGGWEQRVSPKVFGNLGERGILDIWNDPGFRSFREQVISYDYASCSSCTLAPCDYVQTDEFQQDCHIRSVPCGACLWCMGIFQCLQ